MNVKQILKSNSRIRKDVKRIRIYKAFFKDAVFFANNYIEGKETQERLEYRLLFLIHNIEKGMSRKGKRPFGTEKIKQIISYLNKYEAGEYNQSSSAYHMGRSVLIQWLKLWNDMGWEIKSDMQPIVSYIKEIKESQVSGVQTIYSRQLKYVSYEEVINGRHSIRDFAHREISEKDIESIMELVAKTPSACNRQMCKAYFIKSNEHTNFLFSIIQGIPGFDRDTISFFVVTYDTNALFSSGERNQGYFNAGLFAMSLVNGLQHKGIGSCILQWGNSIEEENMVKLRLTIPARERIATIVAAGYYPEETVIPISARKKTTEIYHVIE